MKLTMLCEGGEGITAHIGVAEDMHFIKHVSAEIGAQYVVPPVGESGLADDDEFGNEDDRSVGIVYEFALGASVQFLGGYTLADSRVTISRPSRLYRAEPEGAIRRIIANVLRILEQALESGDIAGGLQRGLEYAQSQMKNIRYNPQWRDKMAMPDIETPDEQDYST